MAADLAWFRDAKFGMFIHFGLYSLLERGEWVMLQEGISPADYARLAERFNPSPGSAREWAKLAKRAGMRYVVFTTKHHDGFSLFDTRQTDYNSVNTNGRDYVREVVEAFRAEGIHVGLYFSLGDWHYPAYRAVASGDRTQQPALRAFIHGQVRELLTNYGQIELLWYDGAWYDDKYLSAEILDAAGLNAMARELQPDILINERAGVAGDYVTCENECKPAPRGTDWEMCTCINDLWGYAAHDYNFKTANQLIFNLVNCATQGGNFLLNIGPRADGSVPEAQVERLEAVGHWLRTHGEAVYGVERLPVPFIGGGRVTRNDGKYYLHIFYWPGSTMRLTRLPSDLLANRSTLQARVLTTGESAAAHWDGDTLVITNLPAIPPDQMDTVVVVERAV